MAGTQPMEFDMSRNWSKFDADQYEIRRAAKDSNSAEPCEDESKLHRQIIDECNRRGWLFIRSRMDRKTTTDKGVPDFIVLADAKFVEAPKQCEKCECSDEKRGVMECKYCGFPAIGFTFPRILFIECKAKNRKRTPEQLAFAAHANKLGHQVHLVNNFAEFMEIAK